AVYTFFSLMSLLPPRSTLFPYTTLFRSLRDDLLVVERDDRQVHPRRGSVGERLEVGDDEIRIVHRELRGQVGYDLVKVHDLAPRSEEHTSELQSRENLVCRLLLEKKDTC